MRGVVECGTGSRFVAELRIDAGIGGYLVPNLRSVRLKCTCGGSHDAQRRVGYRHPLGTLKGGGGRFGNHRGRYIADEPHTVAIDQW